MCDMSGLIHQRRFESLLPMTAAITICLLATTGCHDSSHYWVLADVRVSLPAITAEDRPLARAGSPAELLAVDPGGDQTVLVAADLHDNPEVLDDERARTFVVVLDGPPARGTYVVTPENARLILNSVWRPARRPYVGLEGRVEILSVAPNGIRAYCVLRRVMINTRERFHVLRGRYRFETPAGDDLRLKQAGIRPGAFQTQKEDTP